MTHADAHQQVSRILDAADAVAHAMETEHAAKRARVMAVAELETAVLNAKLSVARETR